MRRRRILGRLLWKTWCGGGYWGGGFRRSEGRFGAQEREGMRKIIVLRSLRFSGQDGRRDVVGINKHSESGSALRA